MHTTTIRNIECACGKTHAQTGTLHALGWKAIGSGGEWGLLVRCDECSSTMCTAIIHNAVPCWRCKRLVVGDSADPKIIGDDGLVWCFGCARRAGLHGVMPAMTFRAWVQSGDPEALARWRAMTGRGPAAPRASW